MKVQSTNYKISRVILYAVLIALAFLMLVPFAWMLSASLKLDKDVSVSYTHLTLPTTSRV